MASGRSHCCICRGGHTGPGAWWPPCTGSPDLQRCVPTHPLPPRRGSRGPSHAQCHLLTSQAEQHEQHADMWCAPSHKLSVYQCKDVWQVCMLMTSSVGRHCMLIIQCLTAWLIRDAATQSAKTRLHSDHHVYIYHVQVLFICIECVPCRAYERHRGGYCMLNAVCRHHWSGLHKR